MIKTLTSPITSGQTDLKAVEDRLRRIPGYAALFKAAFADDANPITAQNVAKAVGAFERTLVTPSPFDGYLKGKCFKNDLTVDQTFQVLERLGVSDIPRNHLMELKADFDAEAMIKSLAQPEERPLSAREQKVLRACFKANYSVRQVMQVLDNLKVSDISEDQVEAFRKREAGRKPRKAGRKKAA